LLLPSLLQLGSSRFLPLLPSPLSPPPPPPWFCVVVQARSALIAHR
jgi:hypothetical protein